MDQIKDIVSKVIGDMASGKPEVQTKIQRIWQSFFDKKTLTHSAIVGLQKGTLLVNVDSPAWLFQMNLQKRKILGKLKEDVPQLLQIHFRIGKVK